MAEETGPDRWADWILRHRHGGDSRQKEKILQALRPVRDQVLDNADIHPGDTVLDVGAGDGLIGFAALERVGERGAVVFSEVSQDLLEVCRTAAGELGVRERCEFLKASATDLSAIAPASVDAVTVRSVLIYVQDKLGAFREFHRVLRQNGRLSVFEPINRFGAQQDEGAFCGYDLSSLRDLVRRVRAVYVPAGSESQNPMLNFDERDLLGYATDAGFGSIRMQLKIEIDLESSGPRPTWETVLHTAPNPNAPTLEDAVRRSLKADEASTFLACLRERVETERPAQRSAVVYLKAVRTA